MFLTRAKNIYYPVIYRKHFSSFAMEDLRKLLSLFSLWDLGRGDDNVRKTKGEVRAARSNERRSEDEDELDIMEAAGKSGGSMGCVCGRRLKGLVGQGKAIKGIEMAPSARGFWH